MSIRDKLNQPFPFTSSLKESWKFVAVVSLFVFLFILIFNNPAGSTTPFSWKSVLYPLSYGVVTFATASINLLILDQFITPKREQAWKVKHEIAIYFFQFFTISIFINILTDFLFDREFTFTSYIGTMTSTMFVGGIPVIIQVFNEQNKLLKKHLSEASNINERPRPEPKIPDDSVAYLNENAIPLSNVLYAEADKNYVNIYYRDSTKKRIRSTLKEFGERINQNDYLVRCHRAFFVNTRYIQEVSGNAQGLQLYLNNNQAVVPVSRPFIPVLKQLL